MNPLTVLAETTQVASVSNVAGDKAQMVMVVLAAAALSLGLIGFGYMNALGRNPESGKAASSIVIIAAMVEVTALLVFAGIFVLN